MNVLDELLNVPWSEIGTASGTAGHVPAAVAGLLSPDENVRIESYWQLDNEVVLQSDLYEAAYFLVPFLVQILAEKPAYGRDLIYDLVFEIANGSAPESTLCETEDGSVIPLGEACIRRLSLGENVFRNDTNDPDPRVRGTAQAIMEVLAEKAGK